MRNLYYKIWVDAIVFERTKHSHMRDWKFYTLMPMSVFQGLNLGTILFWLGPLIGTFYIDIDIFPGRMLDGFLSGFITLILPFLILNYLLIFRNRKYEDLIERFDYKKGKLYTWYVLLSAGLFLGPIFIIIVLPLLCG